MKISRAPRSLTNAARGLEYFFAPSGDVAEWLKAAVC